jgi:hypothetical protein
MEELHPAFGDFYPGQSDAFPRPLRPCPPRDMGQR